MPADPPLLDAAHERAAPAPPRAAVGDAVWPPYTARMATDPAPLLPFLSLRVMASAQAYAETFDTDTLVIALAGGGERAPRLVAAEQVLVRMPNPHAYGLPDRRAMRRAATHLLTLLHSYAFSGRHLVIHCPDGLSRSRSVAAVLSAAWAIPVTYASRWTMTSRLITEAMQDALAAAPLPRPPEPA